MQTKKDNDYINLFKACGIEDDFACLDEIKEEKQKNDDLFYFSQDEIIDDMVHEFKHYDCVEDYVKNIMSVAKAKYEFNRLCQGYNAGYNISLLFNPHRLDTSTIQSQSMFQAINSNEQYRKCFARYCVKVQNKVETESNYYRYIGIGSGGIQYVNEFQPYLARAIYKKFCKDGDKILDPCSGWGGRTLGLASCMFKNIEYITSDPSFKTWLGLLKLREFLNLDRKQYQYNRCGFENLELKENYFDFCFTSPPYFDTERYSDDKEQSYKTNSNYEEWRNNFLYVMLDKIIYALKPNAYCLLNVGKVRYPIDTDIINYLKKRHIKHERVSDFKIGGNGIGARTNTSDDENKGEPFIAFRKKFNYE